MKFNLIFAKEHLPEFWKYVRHLVQYLRVVCNRPDNFDGLSGFNNYRVDRWIHVSA